ncbi:MAG TPA: hypothetical protein VGB83_10850 [Actinomycetota bacterium]
MRGELFSAPWGLLEAKPKNHTIRVLVHAGCTEFGRLDVDESQEGKIVVAALIYELVFPEGIGCAAALNFEDHTYELDRPVGSRSIVHVPVDPDWPGPQTMDERDVQDWNAPQSTPTYTPRPPRTP